MEVNEEGMENVKVFKYLGLLECGLTKGREEIYI